MEHPGLRPPTVEGGGGKTAEVVGDEPVARRGSGGDRRRRPRVASLARKLTLLGVASLLCLGVLEVVFRVLGYQPLASRYSSPELFWRDDPVLGWSLEPNRQGRFVGPRPFPVEYRTTVRTNSLGLRGPDPTAMPDGGRRVVVLGDSVVAGFEVEENETYSSLLAPKLQTAVGMPVQVVNAGVRGYGTDQEYLLYRERLRELRPHLVVLHVTANDPDDDTTLHRMQRRYGKPAFAFSGDGGLRVVGQPVPRYPACSEYRVEPSSRVRRVDGVRARVFCWTQMNVVERSALLSFLTARLERQPKLVRWLYGLGREQEQESPPVTATTTTVPAASTAPPPAAPSVPAAPSASVPPASAPSPPPITGDYAHRLTTALILALGEAVRADGAKLAVVGHSADLRDLNPLTLNASGVPVISLDRADVPGVNAIRIPNDGHFNRLGHSRIADLLVPELAPLLRP